jgi:hypothetical protein
MPPSSDRDVVFILAPARSCSTVAIALLSGHPLLYGFPELLIFTADTIGGLLGPHEQLDLPPDWRSAQQSGILRAVAEIHDGDQDEAAISRARTWLAERADWPTTGLLDHLLDAVRPRTGMEKSPDTLNTPTALKRCLEAYPRARYLHLTRHPHSTAVSMAGHRARIDGGRPTAAERRGTLTHCWWTWYRQHTNAVVALNALPPQRWLRIRAEDLIGDPLRHLPRVLRWLEVEVDDTILRDMCEVSRWPFTGGGESGRLGGGDPGFLDDPVLRPVPAPPPMRYDPHVGFDHATWREYARLAALLGYR